MILGLQGTAGGDLPLDGLVTVRAETKRAKRGLSG
jgi:hypothetical protein